MKKIITEKLNEIEQKENITILLAIESGSRAWGFASPDSDYDVCFLYVRSKEFYLQLNKTRDVIEYMLNDELDINGWDIDKTLRLLHSSNPTLFEWLRSPIIYKQHPFTQKLKSISESYFLIKPGLHHYLNMAEGNYRKYLKEDIVKLKKYFYVLRPLLACRHILKKQTPPPMLFEELLYSQMDQEIIPVVEELLEIKKNNPEIGEGSKIQILNDFIETNIPLVKEEIKRLPEEQQQSWIGLNALFIESLELLGN